MTIDSILQIMTIVSGVLMGASILLQQRGASLGAGFGARLGHFRGWFGCGLRSCLRRAGLSNGTK